MKPLRGTLALLSAGLLAACGNPSSPLGGTAGIVAADEVAVSGHIAAPGTKGPLLVYALAGDAPEHADRETLAVAAVDAGGNFAFTFPPADGVEFAFLADGANDGVIDGGDPIAVLGGPSFASLGGGELITLTDIALDFGAHKATAAAIDVQHGGTAAATFTPTAVPPPADPQ